ncbi:MAG TPA: lamin tail domain-containing protein, partial [Pyrinomonadaceae bacterium]
FVEIYNNSDTDHTVAATDGSSGYALVASNGVARFVIPNGTVIPARGHYLGVNTIADSLGASPAGNGTTATGDATFTTDISDNAGVALFSVSNPANFTLANRFDAVGSSSEANTLYREGTGYPALIPFSIDHSFVRKVPTAGTGIGLPVDSDDNNADFLFVDTNGTSAGAGQRLGAPGPENLSGPTTVGNGIGNTRLDPAQADVDSPNVHRDFTSDPPNNSTFGTISIRRTFTNNTGANITRLRFRVLDISTFPSPSAVADLRPRTSVATNVTLTDTSNVLVQGTTLEQPPSQPNGGGFNSAMSAGTVSVGTPLANGASINLQFLMGIQQTGCYKLAIIAESLPGAGSDVIVVSGDTQGGAGSCGAPTPTPGGTSLVISEFRLRGPNGAADEFVEIYNNSDDAVNVAAADGSGGYALAGSDGIIRFVIPNGTIIPGRGHYLGVNSTGYSLGSYPAGTGSTATGDATFVTNIPDNAGIALFKTSNTGNFSLANRLDAAGSTSEANTLYKEGTGYPALIPFSIDHSFHRKVPSSGGAAGQPQDTGDNAVDFMFVDTNGTSAGAGQRLGAPGPENMSGPRTRGTDIGHAVLDATQAEFDSPNVGRDFTSDPANNSTFGTISIRRTFTNNTGGNITRLRFRVIDLTTFPAPSGIADLRP